MCPFYNGLVAFIRDSDSERTSTVELDSGLERDLR